MADVAPSYQAFLNWLASALCGMATSLGVLIAARVLQGHDSVRDRPYLVRAKGKPMRLLVQAVGERVRTQYDRPWGDEPRLSQLVVIGEHDDVNIDAIRAVLGA